MIKAGQSWQSAARRLARNKRAVVIFSSAGLGDDWGTCYTWRGFPVLQVRAGLGFWDRLRTMVHESFHVRHEDIPLMTNSGRLVWKQSTPRRVGEAAIYRAEHNEMQRITRLYAQSRWAGIDPGIYTILPSMIQQREAAILEAVGRVP